MPSKKKRSSLKGDLIQTLRGGKAPPRSVVQHCLADMHQRSNAELNRGAANELQMAKHLDQVHQPTKLDLKNPGVSRSLDGLLGLHQKFAKQKVAAPKLISDVGGLFPGRIAVNAIPPFDFDHVLFGGPNGILGTREATANRLNGQIEATAITSASKGFGGASAYGVVGLYFHPFGSGSLTVRATPKYSFQWWTNSIRPTALVKSHGSISLVIYGVDAFADTTGEPGTIVSNAATNIFSWDEEETNQVRFDFKFDQQTPGVVTMNVDHSLVYYLFVAVSVGVHGVGWPGSLAGSKLSVTVPSIAYDFQTHPILQQ